MGATQSKQTKQKHNGTEKHTSADSSTPLKVSDLGETELEGHSNVSRPPPPPRLHRLSELLDPAKLDGGHVRSPSGNILAPDQFLAHPDRPRSIRERQEDIREKVRAASRLGVEVQAEDEAMKTTKKRSCCSCFR